MEKFDIFRYIRKWRHIIAIFCIVMLLGVYYYIGQNQVYTANVVISYTNADAKTKGVTRYGDKIDTSEITSTIVIADVIEQLGLYCTVDDIRSNVSVDPIIDEDEETKKQAKLEDGEDYVYYNTDYTVSFSVNSNYSKKYAQNVLNQLIKSYITFYGEKYLNTSISGISLADITTDKHDYLDCVELTQSTVNTLKDYVNARINVDKSFRSSSTGYAFDDFSESLNYISDYAIPKMYSLVTNNDLTLDWKVLSNRLKNDISQNQKKAENLKTSISDISTLMKKYEDKYKNSPYWSTTDGEGSTNNNSSNDSNSDSPIIIDNVEDKNKLTIDATTTYDELIQKFVDQKISYKETLLAIDYSKKMYGIFNGVNKNTSINTATSERFLKLLGTTVDDLTDLYNTLNISINEYNQKVGSDDLKAVTSSTAYSKINVRLYMIMAVILFGIIGICGSIVLGRLGDFIRYFLYIDKKSGLPNRIRCDAIIAQYEKDPPEENFACIIIKVKNLNNINKEKGFTAGNDILQAFGKTLSAFADKYGFIGYNNGDSFIALFENCSDKRAVAFIEQLKAANTASCEKNLMDEIKFSYAISTTDATGVYDIHKLLAGTYKNVNKPDAKTNIEEERVVNVQGEAEKDEK